MDGGKRTDPKTTSLTASMPWFRDREGSSTGTSSLIATACSAAAIKAGRDERSGGQDSNTATERERGGNERYRRSIVWCLEREREKVVCEPDAGLGGRVRGDLCAVRGRHCSPMSQGVVSPWRRGRARWDRVRSGEP